MDSINRVISALRKTSDVNEPADLRITDDPVELFRAWLQEALDNGMPEPNAMHLSTVGSGGKPSSRVVLLRAVNTDGFVFYTNYNSIKGQQLAQVPYAALGFFWAQLQKQVRVEGRCEKIDVSESDNYFRTRPRESQIGALASAQSRPLDSRYELERKVVELSRSYEGKEIVRPAWWGGFRVVPEVIEFWMGRSNRLHDRIRYERTTEDKWTSTRLYP